MTAIATKQKTKGQDMVDAEINYDLKTAKVVCPTKSKAEFTVRTAPGGYIFYEVGISKGSIPQELSGRFSGLDVAVKAVSKYLEHIPVSKTVKVENNRKRAKEFRDAAADHTEGSK